jgi:soluble lytic murein transglycosylase-like protein
MHKGTQERGDVFEFERKRPRNQPRPSVERQNRTPPPAPRRSPQRSVSPWQSMAMFSMGLLLLLSIGLAYQAFEKAALVQKQLDETVAEMTAGMQELRAGVDFGSVRRRLLLGMRDEILRINDSLSLSDAYHYAELLLDSTDRYPSVDPILLLSIGIVESGFNDKARSPADARGLYQIWPATGRMLAGMLGWEYEKEMLYDSERNTEMAALYLDVLLTAYNDLGLALAEYNGGPINAGYYRAQSRRTAAETMDYVPKVLAQYQRLTKELPVPPGRSYDILYRDAKRAGKKLGEPKQLGSGE